jgi:CP family cyanate transporter-like MFS transporter
VSTHHPAIPRSVLAGLFVASIALRPQVLIIGPLVPIIRTDLDLSASVAALLTTLPVLCMGLFAPAGPRIAARFGPRVAFAGCLAVIAVAGLLRAYAPGLPVLLVLTIAIGIGIGAAGAIPSMVVAGRIPWRPALGTGAYAAGIVTGSTVAAAVAVPLAGGDDWRRALLVVSAASCLAVAAWLVLVSPDARRPAVDRVPASRIPWRNRTGWLLVFLFGMQSVLYYGAVAWLPNVYVEHGWSAAAAGSLVALLNGIGLITTIGVPLVADRLGGRRWQLVASSSAALIALIGIALVPDPAYLWVTLLLTLPIDVTDDPRTVGAVAALMLLGGYILSSLGPLVLGAARDVTGDFTASLWLLVVGAVTLVAGCLLLSPARLRRGIRRGPVLSSAP